MPKAFIILLLIAGVIILGIFYLRPQWEEFNALKKDSEELQSINLELDDLIGNLNAIGDSITKIDRENLQRLDSTLPKGPSTADFLVSLEAVAIKNGLLLRRTDVTGADTANKPAGQPRPTGSTAQIGNSEALKDFGVTISVVGSYESFKQFLKDLERMPRINEIKEISFNAPSKQFDTIEYTVLIKTYYQ